MEVIYTGLHQTPEQVVDTAIQEDADGIGLSILSGAHMSLCTRVLELLKERDAADIKVFCGGIIPPEDIVELKAMGVADIFTPGTPTTEVVAWVTANLRAMRLTAGPGPGAPSGPGPLRRVRRPGRRALRPGPGQAASSASIASRKRSVPASRAKVSPQAVAGAAPAASSSTAPAAVGESARSVMPSTPLWLHG